MLDTGTEQRTIEGSALRLIDAVLGQWASQGSSAMSARSLAIEAGVPVSSIYHHFGSLEHLYLAAQSHARAHAQRWCEDQLSQLDAVGPLSPAAFPTLLAALIDDWAENGRRMAFAWRECILAAAREPRFAVEIEAWRAIWTRFWGAVCDRCDRSGYGDLTALLFYNESLFHLIRWRRVIDRAALQDLCDGWSRWLAGELADEGPSRAAARTEAARTMPSLPVLGELSGRIAQAAAAVLQRDGLLGLTHRAVAAEASLTLGVVSHHVRTSADLVRAAFEMVYRTVAGGGTTAPQPVQRTDAELVGVLVAFQNDAAPLRALDELLLAAARDPSLSGFVPQLRYLRGRTSALLLPSISGGRTGSPLDHALLSAVISGLRMSCIGLLPDERTARVTRVVETLARTLRPTG
jgi:AcrR family transcriptional regulator